MGLKDGAMGRGWGGSGSGDRGSGCRGGVSWVRPPCGHLTRRGEAGQVHELCVVCVLVVLNICSCGGPCAGDGWKRWCRAPIGCG